MSTRRLYLFVLCSVLCWAGCGQDRSNPPSSDASTPSTSPSRADTATGSNASDGTASTSTASDAPLRVLVLGNSIAAGYDLPSPETQSFPGQLQKKVDSLGWDVAVQNAGLSGDTSAGGRQRVGWLMTQPIDVLVLELGGNDGLRGVDLDATRRNLTAIVDTTLQTYPDAHVLLAGMQIPPNLGPEYTEQFRQIYPSIAEAYPDRVTLIPFVLEGVGGVDSLMQDDGIHPTAEGQRIVAQNVWTYLRPVLERMRTRESSPAAP